MSEQATEQANNTTTRVRGTDSSASAKQRGSVQLDPAASAALALAVRSAKAAKSSQEPQRATASLGDKLRHFVRAIPVPRHAPSAAALALAAALAGMGGAYALAMGSRDDGSARLMEATTRALRESREDIVRLTGDIKALKGTVDSLKSSLDASRNDMLSRQKVVEKIDRASQETAAKLAKATEQLDRVEIAAKDPAQKLAGLQERLDRIERQMTTLATAPKTTPTTAADVPAQTGSVVEQKSPKETPLEGWVLHDVYDGMALIEGRNRRLIEVGPGATIPGVGRVETIERRGKTWVVVTSKGFIGTVR